MSLIRILAVASIAVSAALLAAPAGAQSQGSPPQAKPVQARPAVPAQVARIEPKCLRALNGACTNPAVVDAVTRRAEIIPAVRVSYFGTPAGTIGGAYIPFERLYQDNALLFGLPTFRFAQSCCITRSK
jgi:hypothetical protein